MVSQATKQAIGTVFLLIGSNFCMNTAWYLHLKFNWKLIVAIFISWGIAFFEYCLQVPANRMGHFSHGGPFTAQQLKVIQEGISLSTFAIFSIVVLKEKLRWIDGLAFVLIFSGVAVSLAKPGSNTTGAEVPAPAPEVALGPMPVAPTPDPAAPLPAMEKAGGSRKFLQEAADLECGDQSVGSKGSASGSYAPSIDSSAEELQNVAALHVEGSAEVLVASGVDMAATGPHQGMHLRRRDSSETATAFNRQEGKE